MNRQPGGVGGILAFNNNSEDQLVNIIYLYKAPFCVYVWVLQILMYGARLAYFMHRQTSGDSVPLGLLEV